MNASLRVHCGVGTTTFNGKLATLVWKYRWDNTRTERISLKKCLQISRALRVTRKLSPTDKNFELLLWSFNELSNRHHGPPYGSHILNVNFSWGQIKHFWLIWNHKYCYRILQDLFSKFFFLFCRLPPTVWNKAMCVLFSCLPIARVQTEQYKTTPRHVRAFPTKACASLLAESWAPLTGV